VNYPSMRPAYGTMYNISSTDILLQDAIREDVSDFSNHIIICGALAELWYIIAPLRIKFCDSENQKIVILAKEFNEIYWESISIFKDVYLVMGDYNIWTCLVRAGLLKANKLLALSNTETSTDVEAIATLRNIQLRLNTGKGSDVEILIQLIDPKNVKLLPHSNLDPTKSPLYAAGRVYDVSYLDTLMMQTYYNQYTPDILIELINFTNKSVENIGHTNLYLLPLPSDLIACSFYDAYKHFLFVEDTLLIGLYRAKGFFGNMLPYVYTNPPYGIILNEGDRVYGLKHKAN